MASEWKTSLREYPKALGRYWEVLVIGAIPTVLGLLQDVLGIKVPPMIWLWALAAGVMVAQFLAWHRLRVERDQLRRYDVEQQALTQLGVLRKDLIVHQNKPLATPKELGSWITEYHTKKQAVVAYMRANINPQEAEIFDHLGIFQVYVMGGELDQDHIKFRSMIIRDHQYIAELVQDYSRGRPRRRPEPDVGQDSR